jgi:hypothetical protein
MALDQKGGYSCCQWKKPIIGALENTTAVVQSIMGCMRTTNYVIMKHGKHVLTRNKMLASTEGNLSKLPKFEEAPSQKLGLTDKLRNAFCTQAGLSAEAIDRIWEDAQGNE